MRSQLVKDRLISERRITMNVIVMIARSRWNLFLGEKVKEFRELKFRKYNVISIKAEREERIMRETLLQI